MKNKTQALMRIEELLDTGHYTLVSYGLAPNPNGFCFERSDESHDSDTVELADLLNCVDREEINYLRNYYL